jgi:hypothetical protein
MSTAFNPQRRRTPTTPDRELGACKTSGSCRAAGGVIIAQREAQSHLHSGRLKPAGVLLLNLIGGLAIVRRPLQVQA